jgi:TIR domain
VGGVFINYRGEDSDTAAALIDRELTARFGSDRVFLDNRSVLAGVDFVEELLGRLRACSVLLVVIGPRWLTLTDATGQRRIDDPADWVRREIAEALGLGLRVIPVLTGNVRLPAAADLPESIAGLSRRQYVPLRRRYTAIDLAFLIERIIEGDPELAKVAARHQLSTHPYRPDADRLTTAAQPDRSAAAQAEGDAPADAPVSASTKGERHGRTITMTATTSDSSRVYQAARDQHIAGG